MPKLPTPPALPELAIALTLDGRPRYLIAAAAMLPPSSLGGIVSGRVQPTPDQRTRIAEALGRSVEELFPAEAAA